MAAQPPNIDRLSNAFLVIAEESAKLSNVPAFDQGVQILQAIERLEQRFGQMSEQQQQMQQQMQQMQTQLQQNQTQMQLSMQQMLDRVETRSIAAYVLKLGPLCVRSD
jgi:DNA anti-recombination protein RmuC